jgi:integrase
VHVLVFARVLSRVNQISREGRHRRSDEGANLLRHSAATAMLRGGATLDMVGAVLRHRSPDMTAPARIAPAASVVDRGAHGGNDAH